MCYKNHPAVWRGDFVRQFSVGLPTVKCSLDLSDVAGAVFRRYDKDVATAADWNALADTSNVAIVRGYNKVAVELDF